MERARPRSVRGVRGLCPGSRCRVELASICPVRRSNWSGLRLRGRPCWRRWHRPGIGRGRRATRRTRSRRPRRTFRPSASRSPRTPGLTRSRSRPTSRATGRFRPAGQRERRPAAVRRQRLEPGLRSRQADPVLEAQPRGDAGVGPRARGEADLPRRAQVHREAAPGDPHPRHPGHQPLPTRTARLCPSRRSSKPAPRSSSTSTARRWCAASAATRWARPCSRRPQSAAAARPSTSHRGSASTGAAGDYDETYYRRDYYSNGDYDEVFIRRSRRGRYNDCYEAYPDPPTVTIVDVFRAPPPEPDPSLLPLRPRRRLSRRPAAAVRPPAFTARSRAVRGCSVARRRRTRRSRSRSRPPRRRPRPVPSAATGSDNEGVPDLIDGDDPNCQ